MKHCTPDTLAAALLSSGLIARLSDYAVRAHPLTMKREGSRAIADSWAKDIYAALPDQPDALREVPQKRLAARVKAAEDVCVMYGWSAVREQTPRQRATHMLWKRWAAIVGPAFLGPSRHRDLNELEAAASAAAGEGGEG
jgi:hypothetical protein